jgi:SAM-dependent methyltransferase
MAASSSLENLLLAAVDGRTRLVAGPSRLFTATDSWNRFGIRDPSVMVDSCGQPVVDVDGCMMLYFNSRDAPLKDGGKTVVGVAKGSFTEGWQILERPVFEDANYAAQGSILRITPDHHRMYYSANTLEGFRLAVSADGVAWQRFERTHLPTPSMFGVRRMGLPYVTRVGEVWYMVFEGMAPNRFNIYMAMSEDGLHWSPVNSGRPVRSTTGGTWDSFGRANPSLYEVPIPDGQRRYYIFYNGCSSPGAWDLGIMRASSIQGPWQACAAPLLSRTQNALWKNGRIEGARLLKLDEAVRVVFFALPTIDSYAGGEIHDVSLTLDLQTPPKAVSHDLNIIAERAYNDALASKYFNVWDTYPIQRYTSDVEAAVIKALVVAGSDALVLGSGGGRELPILIEAKVNITTVDISAGMILAGRARYPTASITWLEADIHALPLPDKSADLVLCLGAVFNYLHTPALALAEMRRVMRPGATALLSVLNADHPTESDATQQLKDGRLRTPYRLDELGQLLKNAGFVLNEVKGVRYLVDLLPTQWNRSHGNDSPPGSELLSQLLALEDRLTETVPPSKAKFLLINARLPIP